MIKTKYQGRLSNIISHIIGASINDKKFNCRYDVDQSETFTFLITNLLDKHEQIDSIYTKKNILNK